MRYIALLTLAAFGGADSYVHASGDLAVETAYYAGPIDEARNRQFLSTIAKHSVKRLVITSVGGEVKAAIALGQWVFQQGLSLEVDGYCLSSCANYVFPAARHKTIRKGAVVAWHGNYHHLQHTGLWHDDVSLRMERHGEDRGTAVHYVRDQVQRLVRLERDFFTQIGVNQRLCWIGKMPPYSVPNYYFLSVQDMKRFGVDSVTAPPAYPSTDVSGFGQHILFIELDDAVPGDSLLNSQVLPMQKP